jgi:hypothetical protein
MSWIGQSGRSRGGVKWHSESSTPAAVNLSRAAVGKSGGSAELSRVSDNSAPTKRQRSIGRSTNAVVWTIPLPAATSFGCTMTPFTSLGSPSWIWRYCTLSMASASKVA